MITRLRSSVHLPLDCHYAVLSEEYCLPFGMHRSGTSLLTYLLRTLGTALPDEGVGPVYGNPPGSLGATQLRCDQRRRARSRGAYRFIERRIVQIGHDCGCAPFILLNGAPICRILPLGAGA
jgi:hypothetical protein